MKLFATMAGVVVAAMFAGSGVASAQSRNSASHVDFDDQLIQGQVNKGAVHLIERKDSDLGSLVKVRKNYRKELLAGSGSEPVSTEHSVMVAGIPAIPMVKATESAVAPTAAPVAKPAMAAPVKAAMPAAKTAIPSAKKNISKSSKGQNAKLGGSRAISRR